MIELLSYKMYTAEMIKLVKATLEGTTTPIVPFKVDPLEFCREAHKVKDELISNALNLLENDIPIKRFNSWISVEERMPTEDALYLVYAPNRIETSWYNSSKDRVWQEIPKVWADAVTHWMPLPEPPTQESET